VGKKHYDNIRILIILSDWNIVALVTAFIGSCIWYNLHYNLLIVVGKSYHGFSCFFALATELPKEDLLNSLHTEEMSTSFQGKWWKYLRNGCLQIIIVYGVCFGGDIFNPEPDPFWRFEKLRIQVCLSWKWLDWDGSPLYSLKISKVWPK